MARKIGQSRKLSHSILRKKSSGHSMCGQDQVSTLTDNKESVGGRKTSIFTTNISI
jgi:hypothetical protein